MDGQLTLDVYVALLTARATINATVERLPEGVRPFANAAPRQEDARDQVTALDALISRVRAELNRQEMQ